MHSEKPNNPKKSMIWNMSQARKYYLGSYYNVMTEEPQKEPGGEQLVRWSMPMLILLLLLLFNPKLDKVTFIGVSLKYIVKLVSYR